MADSQTVDIIASVMISTCMYAYSYAYHIYVYIRVPVYSSIMMYFQTVDIIALIIAYDFYVYVCMQLCTHTCLDVYMYFAVCTRNMMTYSLICGHISLDTCFLCVCMYAIMHTYMFGCVSVLCSMHT